MNDHTVSQAIEALLVARDLRNMAVARAALPTGYYLRAARLLRDIRGTVIIGTGFPVNDTFRDRRPGGRHCPVRQPAGARRPAGYRLRPAPVRRAISPMTTGYWR